MQGVAGKYAVTVSRFSGANGATAGGLHNAQQFEGTLYTPAQFITIFANLNGTSEFAELIESAGAAGAGTPTDYLDAQLERFTNILKDENAAKLLLVDMAEDIEAGRVRGQVAVMAAQLCQNIYTFVIYAHEMARHISRWTEACNDIALTQAINAIFSPASNIHYGVRAEISNSKLVLLDTFTFASKMELMSFELANIVRDGVRLKQCENCGKFFAPTTRSDEIYCDNVFRNEKTCKQLGYEMKVKNDDILSVYRKIYKTQNARKQRNCHLHKIDARFDEWAAFAKLRLSACREGKITLEELKSDISNDSWMRGGHPHAQHQTD